MRPSGASLGAIVAHWGPLEPIRAYWGLWGSPVNPLMIR